MKRITLILTTLVSAIICGCAPTPLDKKVAADQNNYNIQHPEIVGTNEVGQVIKRYWIKMLFENGDTQFHYIYACGNVITDNHDMKSDRHTYTRVEILFNGEPVNLEDAQKLFNNMTAEKQ